MRNSFDFTGKTVLVIGASRGGIGSAIAEGFAQCGASVSITGSESEPIETLRGNLPYNQLDITDAAAVATLASSIDALDVLVNCAGIARRDREVEIDSFRQVLDVNLVGFMCVATAFRPSLKARSGSLLGIASMYSDLGSPRVPAYGASKAGLKQPIKSLALDYVQDGIRVNALAPGFVVTEQTSKARADPEHYRRVQERTPMGRWGEPADLVGPALFLTSPAAGFVTGTILKVDGGYSAG